MLVQHPPDLRHDAVSQVALVFPDEFRGEAGRSVLAQLAKPLPAYDPRKEQKPFLGNVNHHADGRRRRFAILSKDAVMMQLVHFLGQLLKLGP